MGVDLKAVEVLWDGKLGLTLKWVYGIMVMGRFPSHFLRLRSCRRFFWVSCGVGSRELLMYRVFWVVLREGFRATLGEKGGVFLCGIFL